MPIKQALVVDDSKSAGLALRRLLEQNSVAVDTAESAEAAIDYLRSKHPDVVFMDHIMPGMNGLDAAKVITTDPKTATIPIVMYTSKEDPGYLEQARAHGAMGVLVKPPKQVALAQIIESLNASEAARAPAAAPAAAAAPPAGAGPLPLDAIDKAAREAATQIINTGIQPLLTRLIEEHLTKLKHELVLTCERLVKESISQHQAHEVVDHLRREMQTRIDELRLELSVPSKLSPALLDDIRHMAKNTAAEEASEAAKHIAQKVAHQLAAETARQTATEAHNQLTMEITRVHNESEQMRRQLVEQITEVRNSLTKGVTISPAALDEVRHIARSVAAQKALESSHRTAEEVAHRVAQETVKAAVPSAARTVVNEMLSGLPARVYMTAAAAAGVGVLAAIAVYVMK